MSAKYVCHDGTAHRCIHVGGTKLVESSQQLLTKERPGLTEVEERTPTIMFSISVVAGVPLAFELAEFLWGYDTKIHPLLRELQFSKYVHAIQRKQPSGSGPTTCCARPSVKSYDLRTYSR
jgi:hypothetical protein